MVEQTDETEHTPVPTLGSRSRLRVFVLLAITVAGLFVCSPLLIPFPPALTWAMALAICLHRPIAELRPESRRPNLAAVIVASLSSPRLYRRGASALEPRVLLDRQRAMENVALDACGRVSRTRLARIVEAVRAWGRRGFAFLSRAIWVRLCQPLLSLLFLCIWPQIFFEIEQPLPWWLRLKTLATMTA